MSRLEAELSHSIKFTREINSEARSEMDKKVVEVKSIFPKRRQDTFAEDSWGYKDCFFEYNKKTESLYLRGKQ